jgi:peptidoglycan L-alanyl-D-glutamate endopeptidase CwlK
MINSRDLKELEPTTRAMAYKMLKACTEAGLNVLVTSTFRDVDSQNAIYAQGRTAPGGKVTNARGGSSFHQYRCAFDVVPLVGGKAIWDNEDLWTNIRDIGEACGLESASRWGSFPEWPHFQHPDGLSVKQLAGLYTFGQRPKDWSDEDDAAAEASKDE